MGRAGNYFATKLALIENIKLASDEADIFIPYPQVQVHTTNIGPSGHNPSD